MTRTAQTEARMDVVQEKVGEIEGTLQNLNASSTPLIVTSSVISDLINEFDERSFCQKSFIIFGLPESAFCDNLKPYRLGMFVQNKIYGIDSF